jgi:hypothetical protein
VTRAPVAIVRGAWQRNYTAFMASPGVRVGSRGGRKPQSSASDTVHPRIHHRARPGSQFPHSGHRWIARHQARSDSADYGEIRP